MKLLYNEWALVIKLLEKVSNDEKAAPTERLTAIEALKKIDRAKNRINKQGGSNPTKL